MQRQRGRLRRGLHTACLLGLGALSAPLPASAVTLVTDWDAFDTLMEDAVTSRPDVIYPPFASNFTHTMGLRTFDPGGLAGLTNTPPDRIVGEVPVWKVQTVETAGWFLTSSGSVPLRSAPVGAYDPEEWARTWYGDPPPWIVADPARLSEWYYLRRRERVEMALYLVSEPRWSEYLTALGEANAGDPSSGATAHSSPGDGDRVAFAQVSAPQPDVFNFDLYTPDDMPVDIFWRTSLLTGALWGYAGTVQAVAPYTPSAVYAPHVSLFLHAARGDIDSDGDSIPDGMEVLHFGTNPHLWDSSGDGLSDWEKIYRYGLDPLLRDTDGDGYGDDEELLAGTDPSQPTPGATAASIRYYRDADDRVTAVYAGTLGVAATASISPAGNPASIQERSAP